MVAQASIILTRLTINPVYQPMPDGDKPDCLKSACCLYLVRSYGACSILKSGVAKQQLCALMTTPKGPMDLGPVQILETHRLVIATQLII